MSKNKHITIDKIKDFSYEIKKNILEMAFSAGASSSFWRCFIDCRCSICFIWI